MSRHPLLCLFISVFAFVLLGGCADDLRHRTVFDSGAGDAVISFSVENISLTRSDADMESAIDHAYLLFYQSDANPEVSVPIAAVKAEVSESNPSALTFKMPLSLAPETNYRLIAVANADSYTPEGFGSFKEYLDSWCSESSEDRNVLRLFRSKPILGDDLEFLPMSGGIVGNAPFHFSMQNGVYRVSATLSFRRKVARIDVANIVKEGFVVEGVALCNWRDAVSAVSSDTQLGNRLGSVCGILRDGNTADQSAFVEMPTADENGIQQLREALYCFPSVSYEAHASDCESTALIIKARYGEDSESSYYRINVGSSGNKSEVEANKKYLVTIQSVKGRGASTPEEAYAAEESQIVLSIVEDWDLEGSYAMDDKGNFIVLSTGHLEFDGDVVSNREVRVLTSKGLSWDVKFKADNEDSPVVFTARRLSNISLTIGTIGKNTGEKPFSGKVIVSAETPDGNTLTVDIEVVQNPSTSSEEPIIPEDMPFALIPLSTDRVKIDQNEKTIEIDGFAPECFNSFIDIPFKLYIRKDQDISSVNMSSTLLWPLEGRLSLEPSGQYKYCNESFGEQGSGKVCNQSGEKIEFSSLYESSITQRKDGDIVYISVGAMGPDDPAIPRGVTLSSLNQDPIIYKLIVAPCDAIIEDVIITDGNGNNWLIMDRNVQDLSDGSFNKYIGSRDTNGNKLQAYNYCSNEKLIVPFKYKEENVSFSEASHVLYKGLPIQFSKRTNTYTGVTVNRNNFLNKYRYNNENKPSPQFYAQDNYDLWELPSPNLMQLCSEKMKISKMRIFMVSDVPAIMGENHVPICCYWPYDYIGGDLKESDTKYGYYISEEGNPKTPASIFFMFYNGETIAQYNMSVSTWDNGYTRLVRPLAQKDLEDYKTNYLGYPSGSHRLQLCHPDTYTSEPYGWIPN